MIVNRLTIRELAEGAPAPAPPTAEQLTALEQRRLQALAAVEAPPELMPEELPEDG